jgi:NADPH:quinone reductase-like Zn-dependent oxidoreductase
MWQSLVPVRAVAITAPGGPEVLDVIDRAVRAAGPGEVRIAVRAAAVNPTDIGLREHGGGGDLEPPWIPGMDAAGVVESVGEGVDRLAPDDVVMAAVTPRRPEGGAQAELIVVPAASVVPIPDGASVVHAATLPMNGLTALLGLDLLALPEGATLAVSGGAGLLASYVIPLAKERGLRVLADAKPEDEALVKTFGADVVLPRGEGFVAAVRDAAPDGADALYDTALLGRDAFGAVRDGGAMAVVRGWDGSPTERGIEIRPVAVRTVLERTEWLDLLRERAGDGRLTLRVAAEYAPEQAADAHRAMEAGGLRGRGVIVF